MNRKKRAVAEYSVDDVMWNIALHLLRDFRTSYGDGAFLCHLTPIILKRDIREFRKWCDTECTETEPSRFKAEYQLKTLFKRYRFQRDLYTDQELIAKASDAFVETQGRVRQITLNELHWHEDLILDNAASYIRKVLGPYCADEHRSLCRFGRKATVGVASRTANEADRWAIPISGSAEQISWFDEEIRESEVIQKYLDTQKGSDPNGSTYQEIDCLKLALVPKTFKAYRSIVPNTTIGSYQTRGIGEMMRIRLKRAGYDITKLQMKHRELARSASISGKEVTLDLSSASDSLSAALVRRLLPADWFDQLDPFRISKVKMPGGLIVDTSTYCTMGIGYTFPLQTLLFLGILKGLARVCHWTDHCVISVYGDDMIFSSALYPYVRALFPKLGLIVNVDKTYDEGYFRESCGGDYYCGVDVRPFQPQNGSLHCTPSEYEATMYKFINGLTRRWDELMVSQTLHYLASEALRCVRVLKIVPLDFADDAGIVVRDLIHGFPHDLPCIRPKHVGSGLYRFTYLRFKPKLRKEVRHDPFMWVSLRGRGLDSDSYSDNRSHQIPDRTPVVLRIEELTGVSIPQPILLNRVEEELTCYRSKVSGKRLRRVSTYTNFHGEGRYTRQYGLSRFDSRS